MIWDNFCSNLNQIEVDDKHQNNGQIDHLDIEPFRNYSEDLEQLVRLKEFYL